MRPFCLLAPLLLLGIASAQYVSPAYHKSAEGLSNNFAPFGSTTPARYAQVHDDVPAGPITRLAFRHQPILGTVYPAHTVTCDIWMSSALTTSTSASTTFASNHGPNKTLVASAQAFNQPASDPRIVPGPFSLRYPISMFGFPGGTSLCWETLVTLRSPTTDILHDAVAGANANPGMQIASGGVGCRTTGSPIFVFSGNGAGSISWTAGTATLTVSGIAGPPNAAAFHTIGTDAYQWGSLPLPFELPGTSTAPSGSCSIYNDVAVIVSLTMAANGTVTSSIPFTPLPIYNGVTIYSQLWALDAAANAWGLVTTRGVAHNIVAPTPAPPLIRIFLIGSSGLYGALGPNSGLVTQFS